MSRFLFHELIKRGLWAILALLLYGALPAGQLALVLALLLAVRFSYLVAEARRTPMTLERWEALTADLVQSFNTLAGPQRDALAAHFGLPADAGPQAMAEAQVRELIRSYVPPRARAELIAEGMGAIAFLALLPAGVALWTNDFFSLRIPLGWQGASVAVISLGLYALPRWLNPSAGFARFRSIWWSLPGVPCLVFLVAGIAVRHPYLNPFHPDHYQLAADRVLALDSIIVAGRHADWVSRYARQLDEQGDLARAMAYYREALRLDANNHAVRTRLAVLTGGQPPPPFGAGSHTDSENTAPYWAPGTVLVEPPRVAIDASLADLRECTVVVVPMGEVPPAVLPAIGHAIRNELGLPVLLANRAVAMPAHTRTRGLLTGKQWHGNALLQAFVSAHQPLPIAPVKYLLLTPGDIYGEGANYAFSVSYEFFAVVSLARLGRDDQTFPTGSHRAAKQSLCALIKTFRIPPSLDRECVTSYARSLAEFDRKGNRPTADTKLAFQNAVKEWNRQWVLHKAAPRGNRETGLPQE